MATAKGHQKKRNTGLLYEFLVRMISKSLVEGDNEKSDLALKLVKSHFKKGSELYKEFRLFNSLVKTSVSSPQVAASILAEAKSAARAYDLKKLDREKSILIKNINHGLNDSVFYDQPIADYKIYATIGTLISDWRHTTSENLSRIAQYEDQLVKWLVSERVDVPQRELNSESPGVNRLALKLMTQKLNEKYASSLSESQRRLVKEWTLWSATGASEGMQNRLAELKEETLRTLKEYSRDSEVTPFMATKLQTAIESLEAENLSELSDATITRFMLYAKLCDEISGEDLNHV